GNLQPRAQPAAAARTGVAKAASAARKPAPPPACARVTPTTSAPAGIARPRTRDDQTGLDRPGGSTSAACTRTSTAYEGTNPTAPRYPGAEGLRRLTALGGGAALLLAGQLVHVRRPFAQRGGGVSGSGRPRPVEFRDHPVVDSPAVVAAANDLGLRRRDGIARARLREQEHLEADLVAVRVVDEVPRTLPVLRGGIR